MEKFYLLVVIITFIITSGCNNSDNNPTAPSTKGTISGTITDQATGSGIAGANISTQPATSTVTSINDGSYSIPEVEAGNYTITVSYNGYFPNSTVVTVTANQTTSKNISLSVIPADPVASFNYRGTTVTPATINFQNDSQNATNYLWDFGDGTTSTETNPSRSYNQIGRYTVTLTASNNVTGKSDEMSKEIVITPGKVFLQKLYLDEYPPLDGNGAGWDLTNGPDIFFTIIDDAGSVLIDGSGAVIDDVIPSNLPLYWYFTTDFEIVNSSWDKTYSIRLWDYDLTGNDLIGTTNGFKITQEANANYPTSVSLQNTSGSVKVRIILRWQ